ncbi:PilZ domain-containing protein [Shinella curvata]|uniref:PilZ domain-containing protein n=1 Tax=Shinella curvata TaxID=1817964 RepID=A0ABT8XG55_9HYPH|nr:PilZ domain-containing protein [Shinella curvata]MCJ8053410.1 PilZ domain-containing protein [Shinella curvata]MDO6122742.1 PilZ domain-containing protein [Shinella curvata]
MSIGADPRSAAGLYERKWERFAVNRQGMLMTVGFDLAAPKMRSCKLVDISQGGASFNVTTTIGLPLHYYLSIVGVASRIGCAEVYRNDNRIGVQFIKEIDEELLHTIVRADYFTGGGTAKPKKDERRYMVGVERGGIGSALS